MSLHAGRAAQRGQTQNERTQQRQMQSTQARQARLSRNRREEVERPLLVEYCQRCFGSEEPTDFAAVDCSGDVRI